MPVKFVLCSCVAIEREYTQKSVKLSSTGNRYFKECNLQRLHTLSKHPDNIAVPYCGIYIEMKRRGSAIRTRGT